MSFKKYDSALRDNTLRWIEKVGKLDLLVGIPCYNNEETISYVISQTGLGLRKYFPNLKTGIFVADGGSTDNTRENALMVEIPRGVKKNVDIYRGLPGKGTSFRAVFEAASHFGTKAVVVFDSDLRSLTPEWVKLLGEAVIKEGYEFVFPYYRRHKYDGTITNMIVYPLLRALYGKRVRQPIGGDFGISGEMAEFYISKDVWDTDVAKFGIDVWMSTIAMNEKEKIAQADLGVKIHDPKDPAADLSQMFTQVVSTLFYLMGEYRGKWMETGGSKSVPVLPGLNSSPDIPGISVNINKMEIEFVEGFKHFEAFYKAILSAKSFEGLTQAYIEKEEGNDLEVSSELWAKIIYDFAYTYHTWRRNRRRLVNIMTPLYFGRTASYIREVAAMNWEGAEKVIEEQAGIFERTKDYLRERMKNNFL